MTTRGRLRARGCCGPQGDSEQGAQRLPGSLRGVPSETPSSFILPRRAAAKAGAQAERLLLGEFLNTLQRPLRTGARRVLTCSERSHYEQDAIRQDSQD